MRVKQWAVYEQIKERISQSVAAVGADETGMKVNGKKHWFWTWQTENHTYITHANNHAYSTIENHFPSGLPDATLVHDRYAAHFKCEAEGHQICMAHLLHDIQYIHELYPGLLWSKDFKNLIHQTLQLKQTLDPVDCYRPKTQRTTTQKRLGQLLTEAIDTQYPQAITLQKNLHKHAGHILTFFDHPKVTPDNNASERAIKNIKVKQKISGQFKSEAGDQAFAVLRSVIKSLFKN